jgi:hypothetical protein
VKILANILVNLRKYVKCVALRKNIGGYYIFLLITNMSSFVKKAAAGGGSGPGGGASVASTGSVAVSVADPILQSIQIRSDDPLDIQQQANVVAASANAIVAAIDGVEPLRLWQEIVALIKVYGGWAGAALALSINAYLAVSTNTIQGLIAELPGMLLRILSNPDIPGYVASGAANSVKTTAAIVFSNKLACHRSCFLNVK